MKAHEIAQIYIDLVNAEKEILEEEHCAKDQINALRTKYHNILMDQMREEGIEFLDRFDATRKAYDLIQEVQI